MPKYLVQANYIGEGIKGLLQEGGTKRRAVVEEAAISMGGSLEAIYYAFGETDAFVILNMPDNASMAAVALTVGATGAAVVRTTVLMTPEEIDEAIQKTPVYRPPGR
jgi:uncharacterized protein with GYD domain